MQRRLPRVCAGVVTLGFLGCALSFGATPVLVELFTSEGCSSCPPADALLEKIDRMQPIPGAQLIVLSEHVDYWNHDGWIDPFSSAEITARQKDYVARFSLPGAYTPQLVVDGRRQCVGNDGAEVKAAILAAVHDRKVPIQIAPAANPQSVSVRVDEQASSSLPRGTAIYAVFAQDAADTDVLRGENQGRKLHNVAIAGKLRKLGTLDRGAEFSTELSVAGFEGQRLIVFAQEKNAGKVAGAALYRVPKS